MALTVKTNGSSAANIISAQWFNDYYNLLTGSMLDQAVQITNSLTLQVPYSDPSTALTATLAAGTSLGIGVYQYTYTWVNADGGETKPSPAASITTTSGNQNVSLTVIATGPGATSKRRIYRTKVGGGTFYLLTTIADNTTTTYTDTTADASLGTTQAPKFSTFGASILFNDLNGVLRASIHQDPASNGILSLWAAGTIQFYDSGNSQNSSGSFTGGSFYTLNDIYSGGKVNVNSYINFNSSTAYLQIPQSGILGFKKSDGFKLAEMRNNGNFIIGGSQYATVGTYGTAGSQSFDSFDVGEIFKCDAEYPNGTVVCPADGDEMHRCTHDGCHAASVISYNPGLGLGEPHHEQGIHYVALTGRVLALTAEDIPVRTLVVSDGRGGVRGMRKGEAGFSLGVVISKARQGEDKHWRVGILIRPLFCVLK